MLIGGMKLVSPPCVRPAETPMLVSAHFALIFGVNLQQRPQLLSLGSLIFNISTAASMSLKVNKLPTSGKGVGGEKSESVGLTNIYCK